MGDRAGSPERGGRGRRARPASAPALRLRRVGRAAAAGPRDGAAAAAAGGGGAGTGRGAGAGGRPAALAAATLCAELISSSSTGIGHEALLVGDLVAAVELEVSLAPAQELLEQPVGLEAQGLEELRALDVAPLDQQVDQPAAGRLVLGGGAGEVRGADHPLLDQDLGQPLLQRRG